MSPTTALSWEMSAERKSWSAELLRAVGLHRADLENGDPDSFIAGYAGLSADARARFWAELIVAMAKFESGWKPQTIFHEPPPLSVDSVGLLQLSYEDQSSYYLEPLSREAKSLEDPLVNLRCGTKIMATLVAKDHVVARGTGKASRGAARYWSVLREGHHVEEIKARVRKKLGLK